ncbi:hypothetical protein HDV63DRAFT_381371 [Trichoderma sp. SZMC 28014]
MQVLMWSLMILVVMKAALLGLELSLIAVAYIHDSHSHLSAIVGYPLVLHALRPAERVPTVSTQFAAVLSSPKGWR